MMAISRTIGFRIFDTIHAAVWIVIHFCREIEERRLLDARFEMFIKWCIVLIWHKVEPGYVLCFLAHQIS